MTMDPDEQAIRLLIATWLQATAADDLERVLDLMADDVVFLSAGRPPMVGKDAFAAAARARQGHTRVDSRADIREMRIVGGWAYCWNQLTVTLTPVGGGTPTQLGGPALSILMKKPDGQWVIARDANMIAPVTPSGG